MAFLASIWAGRGAPEATARTIAEIEYGAFIGLLLLYPDADAERRRAYTDTFERMAAAFTHSAE